MDALEALNTFLEAPQVSNIKTSRDGRQSGGGAGWNEIVLKRARVKELKFREKRKGKRG